MDSKREPRESLLSEYLDDDDINSVDTMWYNNSCQKLSLSQNKT